MGGLFFSLVAQLMENRGVASPPDALLFLRAKKE